MAPACEEADICLRTYRRWVKAGQVQSDQRPEAKRSAPQNKLSDDEKAAILATCNQPEYASLPPSQIVPRLADKGIYMASESSFYRVLNSFDQVHHRGRTGVLEKRAAPTSYTATGPNQLWSWDITYCGSTVRGQYYYLYLIEDIYSRKIVGWEVHDKESGELAAALLLRTVIREQCFKQPLVLHSDNGAPMKSLTFKAKMEELGITGSYTLQNTGSGLPSVQLKDEKAHCAREPKTAKRKEHRKTHKSVEEVASQDELIAPLTWAQRLKRVFERAALGSTLPSALFVEGLCVLSQILRIQT